MLFDISEFQEVRSKHGFFDVCRTPELACEVTLQVKPVEIINDI